MGRRNGPHRAGSDGRGHRGRGYSVRLPFCRGVDNTFRRGTHGGLLAGRALWAAAGEAAPDVIAVDVAKLVDDIYNGLSAEANNLYPQAYLAQLFKNQQKLTAISKAMASKP